MIYKLQRPLYTNGPKYDQVLVYNEEGTHAGIVRMEEEDIEQLFGPKYKVYADATMQDDGQIVVHEIVEDQDW